MLNYGATVIIGYLLGCLQTSYILVRYIKKKDIREMGNGNAGASNTTVTLGWKYGLLVGLLDILKGVAAVIIVGLLYEDMVNEEQLQFLMYLGGFFVIVGHNFPFYMGFRGGKGTASAVGMFLAISPLMGLVAVVIIVSVSLLINYISIGALSMLLFFACWTWVKGYPMGCVTVGVIMFLLSLWKHRANMKNIMDGTEKKVRATFKKS